MKPVQEQALIILVAFRYGCWSKRQEESEELVEFLPTF